VHTVRIL